MSHIIIKIDTNNAAFHIEGDNYEYSPGMEVARILATLALESTEHIPDEVILRDRSGNRVGKLTHHKN